ncbi:uncharacterized protein BYT42DRAFT_551732 [Radiomyces spectabilis]|uniref:uncharacterized protein n=1 Tax=Radiomyces spectabilis TaxID=64574 RepID=UPI00221E9224|nr:uncharacterized protein BYT42DRAFT_551732 [Radiomyces spectabilis]KAI8393637.1 hypothetical protein BYT42DRAFT_551732 [Radiomyces spectabilis]
MCIRNANYGHIFQASIYLFGFMIRIIEASLPPGISDLVGQTRMHAVCCHCWLVFSGFLYFHQMADEG